MDLIELNKTATGTPVNKQWYKITSHNLLGHSSQFMHISISWQINFEISFFSALEWILMERSSNFTYVYRYLPLFSAIQDLLWRIFPYFLPLWCFQTYRVLPQVKHCVIPLSTNNQIWIAVSVHVEGCEGRSKANHVKFPSGDSLGGQREKNGT